MAATGSSLFLASSLVTSTTRNSGRNRRVSLYRPMAVSTDHKSSPVTVTTSSTENGRIFDERKKKNGRKEENELITNIYSNRDEITAENDKTLKDYLEECKDLMIKSNAGPPRWFTPLECGSHTRDSPLLLFLPGIDGTGIGHFKHHHKLGKIFDMWCLHIPVKDTTSFTGMKAELRNREKSQEAYLNVKSEVEKCIAYSKEKREEDPYRNLMPRLL